MNWNNNVGFVCAETIEKGGSHVGLCIGNIHGHPVVDKKLPPPTAHRESVVMRHNQELCSACHDIVQLVTEKRGPKDNL